MSYLASLKSPSVALSAANIRIKNIFIDFHFWPRRLMHFGGQDATNISYFLQFFLKYRTSSFFRQFSDTSRKPDQTWNPYYESQFHLIYGNGSMEMEMANVSNIMERVISLSSFKKSILVKYLCCLPRYVSFGSNGMQNICLVEPFWPQKYRPDQE